MNEWMNESIIHQWKDGWMKEWMGDFVTWVCGWGAWKSDWCSDMLNSSVSPKPPLKSVFVNHHILVKQIWLITFIPSTLACKKEGPCMCRSKKSQ